MTDAGAGHRPNGTSPEAGHSQSIEWYHEGQARIVEANGLRIEVRFIGRKGRRGRIAIIAVQEVALLPPEHSP